MISYLCRQYLLENIPLITEHHGIDPFMGGYDAGDVMSNRLAESNSSSWASAVLRLLGDFGCRFQLHVGNSVDMSTDFSSIYLT